MSSPLLVARGNKIVRADDSEEKEVLLRGAGLGGWMNMENVSTLCAVPGTSPDLVVQFITGYPGHERRCIGSAGRPGADVVNQTKCGKRC